MIVRDTLPLIDISSHTGQTRDRKKSFDQHVLELKANEESESLKDMITPPSSTLRKTPVRLTDNCPSLKHPLSPELSSPIAPTKAKKQKSDGGSRSNGNLTIDELLQSLEQRKIHGGSNSKPPYSYATLIGLAILQSAGAKLTLSQIYGWISVHFPYYKQKDSGWQNSIRHNLSLNDAFIKTDKSCDGKGHFWEVKPGSESKFFKGGTATYEEIREKLHDIDRFFSCSDTKVPQTIEEEPLDDSDYEHDYNTVLNIHSSPNTMSSNIRISVPAFADKEDNGNQASSQREQTLNPPYLSRKYHTSTVLPKLEDFNKEHNMFMGSHTDAYMNTSANSSPNIFKASHDFKKYTCSFNSSFEELSPSGNDYISETLLDPITTSSFGLDTSHEVPQQYAIQKSPVATNLQPSQQQNQMELLRTPRNPQQQNFERTPCRFTTTPRDEHSVMKKWQTPSHLFEDIYCSPIFKYMGTPNRENLSPNGSRGRFLSPKKHVAPDINMGRSKISASGLFGVDVYAVWKRATENINTRDSEPKDKEISEGNRNSTGKCDNKGNTEKAMGDKKT